MLSKTYSISLVGINGFVIEIETDIHNGLPGLNMVGLPDTVIKESKERVRSAIKNSGYEFPLGKIIINFAPADIKKEGPCFDLAVAIGILMSSGKIKDTYIRDCIFIGELSLNGEVRSVRGILPMVLEAKRSKFKKVFIPYNNIQEVKFIDGIDIYGISYLNELIDFLNEDIYLEKIQNQNFSKINFSAYDMDFSEVIGQKFVKRAIEISASGNHNLLMIGPPGGGKTMIAQRIPTILPPLSYEQAIEVTKLYSIAGMLKDNNKIVLHPPFRNPHHTASSISIIGGGTNAMPGEVSLAHNGVLFLDELPEFKRDTLEALRQPLEDGIVSISRVKGKYTYPAKFLLIASMNPCPCGYYGYQLKECSCTQIQIKNYLNKISGPLLDRIDLHINVEPIKFEEISSNKKEEGSEEIRKRVIKVREIQSIRYKDDEISYNSQMKTKHIKKYCRVDKKGLILLESAFKSLVLSTRAYNKILKIARTIADMEVSEEIKENHIAEAIQYRSLDRKYWG